MSGTRFSFHLLPEEDRIALTFTKNEDENLPAILLTRKLVKVPGNYLRHYIEKNTSFAGVGNFFTVKEENSTKPASKDN